LDVYSSNSLKQLTADRHVAPLGHISLIPGLSVFDISGFVDYKKSALDLQSQGIKLTICLPMVDGSLRVLRLFPPLKLVAII